MTTFGIFPLAITVYIQAVPHYPAIISEELLHRVLAQEMTVGHIKEKCARRKGTSEHLQNYSTELQPVLTCALVAH